MVVCSMIVTSNSLFVLSGSQWVVCDGSNPNLADQKVNSIESYMPTYACIPFQCSSSLQMNNLFSDITERGGTPPVRTGGSKKQEDLSNSANDRCCTEPVVAVLLLIAGNLIRWESAGPDIKSSATCLFPSNMVVLF